MLNCFKADPECNHNNHSPAPAVEFSEKGIFHPHLDQEEPPGGKRDDVCMFQMGVEDQRAGGAEKYEGMEREGLKGDTGMLEDKRICWLGGGEEEPMLRSKDER